MASRPQELWMPDLAAQPVLASAARAVRTLADLGDPLPAEVIGRTSELATSDGEALLR
jgi:hypothetical protein